MQTALWRLQKKFSQQSSLLSCFDVLGQAIPMVAHFSVRQLRQPKLAASTSSVNFCPARIYRPCYAAELRIIIRFADSDSFEPWGTA